MPAERTAPPPPAPESDFTRPVLEAAVLALPQLLRADGGAVYLPSAERNALRAVARRNLSEPQAQALGDLLAEREVAALLADGRPFLPGSGDGVSPRLQDQLRRDNWPDLIAVPLPGTGRPVGVLAIVPEGDGRWTPGKVAAAIDVGVLLATALRAAVRAGEGERRRRRADLLLDRLPFLRDPGLDRDAALAAVAGGLGDALDLSHCLAVLLEPPAFAEFCRPGAAPIGAPAALAEHPAWRLLRAGGVWSYDDAEASPADRAATARLLNGLHAVTVIAIPVGRGGTPDGALLLIQADRRRRLRDDEIRFAQIAAAELAARPQGEAIRAAPPPAARAEDAAARAALRPAAAPPATIQPPTPAALSAPAALPPATLASATSLPAALPPAALPPAAPPPDAADTDAPPAPTPGATPPAAATPALTDDLLAALRAVVAAATPVDAARAAARALAVLAGVHTLILARQDALDRSVTLSLAFTGQTPIDAPDLPPAPPGDDLLAAALAADHPVGGDAGRAVPRPWRRALRLGRQAAALAVGLRLPGNARAALVVLGADAPRLAAAAAAIELLGAQLAQSVARFAANEQAALATARIEPAESRAEHAESRLEQAESRAIHAESHAQRAEFELTQVAARLDRAESRTTRAESRAQQAEAQLAGAAQPPDAAPATPVPEPPSDTDQPADDFFNLAAHELRGPITTIRGGALTLAKRWAALDAETRAALLDDIADESERLNRLIEDLLTLTRAPARLAVAAEPVALGRLLDRVVAELGGKALGHAVTIRIPPSLPPVEADPDLTRQVLATLLEQVAARTTRGEAIRATAEVAAGSVVLTILGRADAPLPADLDRYFEPFAPSDEPHGGTRDSGLALAVARRLAEAQNGRLWAEHRPDTTLALHLALPTATETMNAER